MARRLRDLPLPLIAAGLMSLGYSVVAARSAPKVIPNANPPQAYFYPGPTIVRPEGGVLTWSTSDATSASIDQGVGPVGVSAPGAVWLSTTVHPDVTTTYTLTAVGPGGTATASVTVKVMPLISLFEVFPAQISAGQTTYLRWSVARAAASVSIDQGVGAVPQTSFGLPITPNRTTTYTMTASYNGVTQTQTATVVVATPANVIVSSLPAAMLEAPNTGGATVSFTISNGGSTATSVTVTPQGDFFTVAPQTVSLPATSAATVAITGLPKPAGTYDGTIALSGNGVAAGTAVPVRMLVPTPPAGTAVATPVSTRIDTAADATSNTVTGTAQFTNTGTSAITALVSSDVPWIIPPKDVITIGAGQTVDITFTIDRSKRPDSSTLLGSLSGTLVLTYLGGPGASAKWAGPFDTTTSPPISVTIVKVVDTVKPPVQTGTPPALSAGEIALYVPGVGHTQTGAHVFASDVSIMNALGTRDLKALTMYHLPIGGSSSSAAIAGVPAAGSVQLADVAKNVFNNQAALASLQLRGEDTSALAVAANMEDLKNAAGTVGTGLPVFRSDRAAAPGESVVLSGVMRDATTTTDILLQEAAGAAANVAIDFYDVSGAAKGNTTVALQPFEFKVLSNSVPADAVLAIVTNSASTPGRLLAYAITTDAVTSDRWMVVDWNRQTAIRSTEALLIPIAGARSGLNNTSFHTDVTIANPANTPAAGTLRFYTASMAAADAQEKRVTLGAHESSVLKSVGGDALGYGVFIPDANSAVAISARNYNVTAAGNFSSTVPVVGVSSFAIRTGQSKRIGAIEDATPSIVGKATPATFRTNVGLVESSGQPVTVRISLLFDEVLTTATARRYGSQTVMLAPNQAILLRGVANMIIGRDRAAFGELRNMQVQVEVLSGSGSVVMFTSTVDNGTGDATIRIE